MKASPWVVLAIYAGACAIAGAISGWLNAKKDSEPTQPADSTDQALQDYLQKQALKRERKGKY